MLHVQLLGTLRVRDGDRPLRLGGAKQRILLAILVLAEGRPVSASRLQEEMWGESEPDRDHGHALQAHVSRLRALLPVAIPLGPGGYRLDPDDYCVDAVAFSELLTRGREHLRADEPEPALEALDRALDLWDGPAIADLAHVASLQPHLVRLEELRQRAGTDRVDVLLALDRAEDTLPDLQARLEANPLEEHTWHQLISALRQLGRLSEALACYQRARETFIDLLGSEPGPLLTALHQGLLEESVKEQADAGNEAPGLSPEIIRRLTTPLAGRERELTILRRTWPASADELRIVTITGEPGIGKTRLSAEFAAERARDGSPVLFGRCDEFMAVPYQPFIEMIRADVGDLTGERLARRLGPYPAEMIRLVPDLAERLPEGLPEPLRSDPHTEMYRTFDAVAGWLATASAGAPVTLILDDLQWADRPSVMLVRHLAHTPRPVRALVLATMRDRERHQASGADTLLGDLARQSEIVTNLPLTGLDSDEVADLLDTVMEPHPDDTAASTPDGGLATWVTNASGGNPLFVVELARNLADPVPGTADSQPGSPPGSQLGSQPGELPMGLRELIRSRLKRLPDEVQGLLQVAAAMGPTFDVEVLARVMGEGSELDDGLAAAEFARLVKAVEGPGLRYAFAHDVVRSALYESIPPVQRSVTHLRIAEAIEEHHGPRASDHATELAHHFTMAPAPGPESTHRAIRYLRAAGDDAMQRRAPSLAAGHYQRALDLLPVDWPVGDRCDLMTALGTAQLRSGDREFREVLLEAGRMAGEAGDAQRLADAAVANNRGWWSSTSQPDQERISVIEAALHGCQSTDPVMRCQLLASWALENARDPEQRAEVIKESTTALDLAREIGDDELLAFTLSHHYAVTYATFSDPRGCVDLNEQIFALARKRADPGLRLNATIGLAQSSATLGEFTVSDRALEQALELSEILHHPARLWMTRTWQAMRLATRGNVEAAEAVAATAYDLGVETGQPDALTWFAGQVFTFRMMQGRLPELVAEIEEQALSQAGGIPSWQAAYAVALTSVGRNREAAGILADFVERDFAQLPVDMLWLHGMCYLSMACAAVEDRVAAAALYGRLAPHSGLVANNGTIDAGPVDLHLGTLALVLGDEEAAAAHLDAAEQTCLRIDAPPWLARVRLATTPAGSESASGQPQDPGPTLATT